MLSKGLERKVKKRLFAQPQTALVRYAPGFAAACEAEILSAVQRLVQPLEWTPRVQHEVHWLRVENLDFRQLIELTACLHTASDIWLVVAEKTIRTKDKLEPFFNAIEWELFLPPGSTVTLRVDSKQSHLYHENMVKEHCSAALQQQGFAVQDDAPFSIWLQLWQDRATVAINLNGEPLYKRGIKTVLKHVATLQEHVAASLIWQHALWLQSRQRNIADATHFYIPCCGSGTFAMEALLHHCAIPTGMLERTWAMEQLVGFPASTWKFLRQQWSKRLAVRLSAQTLPQFYLSDIDEQTVGTAEEHMRVLAQQLECVSLIATTHCSVADMTTVPLPGRPPRVIMIHPPYGKRMPLTGRRQFFANMARRLSADTQPGDSGFCLLPDAEVWHDFLSHLKNMEHHTTHFMQGGLDIRCVHFARE